MSNLIKNMNKVAVVLNSPLLLYGLYVGGRLLVGGYQGVTDDGYDIARFTTVLYIAIWLPTTVVACGLLWIALKSKNTGGTFSIVSILYGLLTTSFVVSSVWMANNG